MTLVEPFSTNLTMFSPNNLYAVFHKVIIVYMNNRPGYRILNLCQRFIDSVDVSTTGSS